MVETFGTNKELIVSVPNEIVIAEVGKVRPLVAAALTTLTVHIFALPGLT
jgi:hypothetical protein